MRYFCTYTNALHSCLDVFAEEGVAHPADDKQHNDHLHEQPAKQERATDTPATHQTQEIYTWYM